MEKGNRILINEDLSKANDIVDKLEKNILPKLNILKQCYDAFDMTEHFSNATLQDAYFNNGNVTIEKYRDHIKKSLKGLPKALAKPVIDDSEQLISFYSNALSKLNECIFVSGSTINVKVFSFDTNKGFYITDERKEQLTENYCRLYVEGEISILFYEYILGVQKAIRKGEKLFNDCRNSKGYSQQTIPQYLAMFFDENLNITNYVCSATDKLNQTGH